MSVRTQDLHALGEFATGTRLQDVPDPVVRTCRLLLLDTLGALLGGLRYPQVRELAASLAEPEPAASGDAPFGRFVTLGTAATWLDADSGGSFHPQGHRLPPVPTAHPAPHSMPVLLHEAATGDVDDRRLLEVFVLANEVGMRAGVASTLRPGMHPHGVHGPAAAALASVLLSGGSAEEAAQAVLLGSSLPLAATLAVPVHGGTVRNLWTGLGSWYGTSAATWVRSGARGEIAVLTGLYDGAVCTDLSVDELVDGLGTRWQLASSYLKPYACARWVHPALDAYAALAAQLRWQDVVSVTVDTFAFAASLDAVDVRSDLHARFSVPWCVATLAVDGVLHAGSFLPESLYRPEVAELARRVELREDPAATAALPGERPARVTVRTAAGDRLVASVRNARGNPSSPLPREEVEAKFRLNVGDTVDGRLVDDLVVALLDGAPTGSRSLGRCAAQVMALIGLA